MSAVAPVPAFDQECLRTEYHLGRLRDTAAICAKYPSLRIPELTPHALALHSRLRDRNTGTISFVHTADMLLRQLVEFAIATLPTRVKVIDTPTAMPFSGCELEREVCGISIVRAGESMEAALRSIILGVRIGKILIQRDESVADKPAHFFYAKLPTGIEEASILLLDPMLASGGSAICAIRHLLSRGVALERITFVCLIAAPEGLDTLLAAFPSLSVVSGILDTRIDERKYILPGVGDFGDRYFGTVENVVEHTEGPKA